MSVRKPMQREGADHERERLLDSPSRSSDDDFILRNERAGPSGHSKLQEVRQQIEEVTAVMKDNVDKLFARGERLDELNERSENLQAASATFHTASVSLRRQAWWELKKFQIALASVGILIIVALIIWLSVKYA